MAAAAPCVEQLEWRLLFTSLSGAEPDVLDAGLSPPAGARSEHRRTCSPLTPPARRPARSQRGGGAACARSLPGASSPSEGDPPPAPLSLSSRWATRRPCSPHRWRRACCLLRPATATATVLPRRRLRRRLNTTTACAPRSVRPHTHLPCCVALTCCSPSTAARREGALGSIAAPALALEVLCLGVAALQAVAQANVTGPDLPASTSACPAQLAHPGSGAHAAWDAWAVLHLSADGEEVIGKTALPQYLVLGACPCRVGAPAF